VRRTIHLVAPLAVVAAMLAVLWPAPAQAQHVRGRRGAVVVHGGYGRPYFYYPGFYYSAFGGPFGWYGYPWGPWGAWGPYPAYAYYDASSSARILGAPPEAEVYVDGYYAGLVDDFDGSFQRLRVPPGEHEVVIYLEGYRSTKQNILFRPRAGYKIRATLEKLAAGEQTEPRPQPSPTNAGPPARPDRGRDREEGEHASSQPAGFGTLAVRVQPAGATVLVDGERWEGPESGDRLLLQLAEGHHEVEVRRDGYQPYRTEVDVRSGRTQTLNVSLPQERR
jgi:hypothetical protein